MKRIGKILVMTVALNISTGVLIAQAPQPAIAQINCVAPQNLAEANDCYQQADTTLNDVYRQVRTNLTGRRKQQLIAAEQAWITFRDAHCAFQISKLDTATARQSYFSCLHRMTQERTQELQEAF